MEPVNKSKNNKVHRYCCSNPNCPKVFSKPKIIKYYVCPSCQTLVDMTLDNFQSLAQEKPGLKNKRLTLRKQKASKQYKKQEPEAITNQQTTTKNELISIEKPEVKEILETIVRAQVEEPQVEEPQDEEPQDEEPNIVEINVNKRSGVMGSDYDLPFSLGNSDEQQKTVKDQASQSSDFRCSYYFGYLSQRNKEEVIPETCFGCLKSIECMMSEYNKPKETVEEIKKWYSFK